MPTVRSQTDKALLYSGANVENNFNSELDKKNILLIKITKMIILLRMLNTNVCFYDSRLQLAINYWLKKRLQTINLDFRKLLTDTLDSSVIQIVSKGAFTAERTICVDADAVLANTWVIQTLVHI